MRICMIADGQSPHCQNWLKMLAAHDHEVHLITTYPCSGEGLPLASLHFVPLDFSARIRGKEKAAAMGTGAADKPSRLGRLRGTALWRQVAAVRNGSMPLAIALQRRKVRRLVDHIRPDVVHSMRITFEGILAAQALAGTQYPLIASVWGNDFTLYAAGSETIGRMTRRALQRIDALHPDTNRDLRLAREQWGFDSNKPALVAPGNGGLDSDLFRPPATPREGRPIILNPRGLKPYVRNDSFFASIPLILKEYPEAFFKMSAAKGKPMAEEWVSRLGIEASIELMDAVSHSEMARLFAEAVIVVSPSEHDGTPNTLLEAMACGAFPVAGNIESVREWIEHGKNGFLFDPGSAEELASQVVAALRQPEMMSRIAEENRAMVIERADKKKVEPLIERFYAEVVARSRLHV